MFEDTQKSKVYTYKLHIKKMQAKKYINQLINELN